MPAMVNMMIFEEGEVALYQEAAPSETALYVLRGRIIDDPRDRVTFSVIRHVSTR